MGGNGSGRVIPIKSPSVPIDPIKAERNIGKRIGSFVGGVLALAAILSVIWAGFSLASVADSMREIANAMRSIANMGGR